MSARNGNISRFNRLRKKKIAKRLSSRTLQAQLAQSAAAAPAKDSAAS
ncbi:MAG: hypothetical protein JWN34_960 [Bryobacterales bacterium]|jgi:hypothetical protein|nr:hypothetical protein [Bryobacterales bacterium]